MSGSANEDVLPPKRTALAIIVAVVGMLVFYVLYRMLFGFVIFAYASYDPSFATGIGALVLMGFGTNVLGAVSGAAVTKWLFPRASASGVYYALATVLIIVGIIAILREAVRSDGSWVIVGINAAIIAATIFALKLFLRPSDARLLSD